MLFDISLPHPPSLPPILQTEIQLNAYIKRKDDACTTYNKYNYNYTQFLQE